jgi:predicted ArsR family transcriptional regulator
MMATSQGPEQLTRASQEHPRSPDHARAPEHTPRRRAVLEALRAAGASLGVADRAERLALHPNTVRFHLDALVSEGAVERAVEQPSGPGRPRTVYAVRPGMDRGGERRYRLLAQILLSRLAAEGSAGEAAAIEAGQVWGRHLVEPPPPFHRPTAPEAVDRLTAMLADLGFDPDPTGDPAGPPSQVRLRHCPFLELAEEYGSIVCPLHLGLMQGALTELRAPVAAGLLEPFAEPDACLAHLVPAQAAATPEAQASRPASKEPTREAPAEGSPAGGPARHPTTPHLEGHR